MGNLRVSDLVDFKESDYKLAKSTMVELDVLCDTYSSMIEVSNPTELDKLKRKFVSHMSTLTNIYATIKAFKGSNHTYLEECRKEFKAEAYQILIDDGVGSTAANNIVYRQPYYKDRISLMKDLKAFFIKVDEKYTFYTTVLQLIQQTVSIISKDFEHNRHSG